MDAQSVVAHLLDQNPLVLAEASVHLPRRGTKWVAVYTGPEHGKQIWKSTGLTDRTAALALARKWEAQARRQRLAQGAWQRPGTGGPARLTQKEVAALLNMSERGVRKAEKRALAKLRKHPALRSLWGQIKGETSESAITWQAEEVAALFALAAGSQERQALKRLFGLVVRND
jgi:Sigma-70, region 4